MTDRGTLARIAHLQHLVVCYERARYLQRLLDDGPQPSPLPELASLASKSALAFCSLGTWINSNAVKDTFKVRTYSRYAAICGSLAWNSPVTYPVTNRESVLAINLLAPISFANSIPTIRALYSAWLLLALKAKRRDCSISTPFGPSRMTPAPLPC